MLAELRCSLARWNARDLILDFDGEFDARFEHGLCIGLLEMLGADYRAPAEEPGRDAEWLGMQWCRIVEADVHYRLAEGLDTIARSRAIAARLDEHLRTTRGDQAQPSAERSFIAYVVARWHDGAGRIHYRCADYSNARLSFQTARRIAVDERLSHCEPDITSDWLRAEFEERDLVKQDIDLAGQYRDHIGRAQERLRSVPGARSMRERRELKRGLSSLNHNLSVELKRLAQFEDALRVSRESEALCVELGDEYRLGQALNLQALIHLDMRDAPHARVLFERVLNLAGPRSRRIALQNLAKLDRLGGELSASHVRLSALIKELRAERETQGGAIGLDAAFQFHTVDAWSALLGDPRMSGVLAAPELQAAREEARQERIAAVRSLRNVVQISQYKLAFSRHYHDLYQELIGRELDAPPAETLGHHQQRRANDGVFSLVEEASSRELMDLLQNAGDLAHRLPDLCPTGPLSVPQAEPPEGDPRPAARRSMVATQTFGAAKSPLEENVFRALEERRAQYERHSLEHPIPTSPHNPQVAHDLRMFTANNPGLVVVRFFMFSDGRAKRLAAFIFRDGDMALCPLDMDAVQRKVLEPLARATADQVPPLEIDARNIFTYLIKPWWDRVKTAVELVVVPTDDLFKVPLHVALLPEGMPIGATIPMAYSVSANAFLYRGRHLLRRQRVYENDDLCAVLFRDEQASGGELVGLEWPRDSFFVAGSPQDGTAEHRALGRADWSALSDISRLEPEFFLYSGHGIYYPQFGVLGPALVLEDDVMTQYDVAMRLRLPHNRLTFLAACVTGEAGSMGGGELSGFLRAFIAAGSGVLGVTLWPVLDERVAAAVRHVLNAARRAATHGSTFEVTKVLYEHYRKTCEASGDAVASIEACPIALYL